MAFTNTTLSITPLLETTFISDMRIIVNSNVTVLKSKLEDVINTLQIDLVNKYIGTDIPISLLRTESLTVTNQFAFKTGNSANSATIASLTQSGNVSTFYANNLNFDNSLIANANVSRAALKTIVVGGTSGGTALNFPTSAGAGIPDPGLYVGDTTTPVKAMFYGNVGFAKTAITQSSNYSAVREIVATLNSTYSTVPLIIGREDPQYLMINVKLSDNNLQSSTRPIWIQLHENFTTTTSRPEVGQSFTIIFNKLLQNSGTEVAPSAWPSIFKQGSSVYNEGLNITPGWANDATPGTGKLKPCYLNNFSWTSGLPTSATNAYTRLTGPTNITDGTWVRLYTDFIQGDSENPNPLGACVTITKVEENAQGYSRYIITGGSNYRIMNNPD
jgi:hypothetical protein